MSRPNPALPGREAELAALDRALDGAERGQGSVWLVTGEPGVGKSRVAEELAAHATARGFTTLWGRCWEAGGAPPYWPWIQVLRALGRVRSEGLAELVRVRAPAIEAWLPDLGLGARREPSSEPGEPETARFRLFDAIASLLCDAAEHVPLCIVLEDLHAADASSLSLLSLLSDQSRTARVLTLATARSLDGMPARTAEILRGTARGARRLELGRLRREAVGGVLRALLGRDVTETLIETAFAVSEGHALFLTELARFLALQGDEALLKAEARFVPDTLRTLIAERLLPLDAETRVVLEVAAVMGREFRSAALADALGREPQALLPALARATDGALLTVIGGGQYRFSHVLFRDVLYQDMPHAARERAHSAVAASLERVAAQGAEAATSEIAHHYLAAGAGLRERAREAARAAGRSAQAQWAFEEAARWYEQALAAGDSHGAFEPGARFELLLALGQAQLHAGDVAAGKAACAAAAALAREHLDGERFAQAALGYGSVFLYGEVDPVLVELLEEAQGRLPAAESALGAHVLARLAAALQPAADPEGPIALALRAIEMARRVGDDRTLLAVLRAGCSALQDLADPRDRRALNQELVELARRLNEPVEAWRGGLRLVFDYLELGETLAAHSTLQACERAAERLRHPSYRWRVLAMRGTLALYEGRFAEAEHFAEQADEAQRAARDPIGSRTLTVFRAGMLRARGRWQELLAVLPEMHEAFAGVHWGGALTTAFAASTYALLGREDTARAQLSGGAIEQLLAIADPSLMALIADAALELRDTELCEQVAARLRPLSHRFVNWGMVGMLVEGPFARLLAKLEAALGQHERAARYFEEALERARRAHTRAAEAWIALDYAAFLTDGGDTSSAQRAELLAVAERLADELDIAALKAAAQRLKWRNGAPAIPTPAPSPPAPSAPGIRDFTMHRDGEIWTLTCKGQVFRLKDSKGLQILSRLIAEPEREFHVMDLLVPAGTDGFDAGDAGELLDAEARDAYRARVRDLDATIEEAEARNDVGRAHDARAEREAIANELARAFGLGGRARRGGAAVERARINVQRRLKDALRRIDEHHGELGKYLERALQTGTFCSYRPG